MVGRLLLNVSFGASGAATFCVSAAATFGWPSWLRERFELRLLRFE